MCVWASSLVCWLYLIKVSIYYTFYISPLLSGFFSGSIANQEIGFLISVAFLSISARKDLSSYKCSMNILSHIGGKVQIGNLLESHLSNERQEGECLGTFYLKPVCYQDHGHWGSSEALYHLQSFMSQNFMWPTSNKPNLDILGKLSHPMCPASVLGNFYFHFTRWCAVWSGFGAFFRDVMWIQCLSIPWSLVAQVLVSSARNRPFHIGWGNLFWRYLFQ